MIKCGIDIILKDISTDFDYLTSNWNRAPRHFFFAVSQIYLILKIFETPQTFRTSETLQILQIYVTFQISARLHHLLFQTVNKRLGWRRGFFNRLRNGKTKAKPLPIGFFHNVRASVYLVLIERNCFKIQLNLLHFFVLVFSVSSD